MSKRALKDDFSKKDALQALKNHHLMSIFSYERFQKYPALGEGQRTHRNFMKMSVSLRKTM